MFVAANEGAFTNLDSEFVVSEGEISDATEWKLMKGRVVAEMERLHQTSLNRDGDDWAAVASTWRRNGDYDQVVRRLGHRLRLVRASAETAVRAGSHTEVCIEMANDGFARVLNPRGLELWCVADGRVQHRHPFAFERGNRLVLPGPGQTARIDLTMPLPAGLVGRHDVHLALPDPSPRLHARPDYSLRLANESTWQPDTGSHRLGLQIDIRPS